MPLIWKNKTCLEHLFVQFERTFKVKNTGAYPAQHWIYIYPRGSFAVVIKRRDTNVLYGRVKVNDRGDE